MIRNPSRVLDAHSALPPNDSLQYNRFRMAAANALSVHTNPLLPTGQRVESSGSE
jgi:hypothetical protein